MGPFHNKGMMLQGLQANACLVEGLRSLRQSTGVATETFRHIARVFVCHCESSGSLSSLIPGPTLLTPVGHCLSWNFAEPCNCQMVVSTWCSPNNPSCPFRIFQLTLASWSTAILSAPLNAGVCTPRLSHWSTRAPISGVIPVGGAEAEAILGYGVVPCW